MQSKDRRIIIYFDVNDLKKQYRTRAKDIWTLKNVLENEEMINSNLFNCLCDLGETIMAYISMKDEVNILSCINDLESLQVPYINNGKISNCLYSDKLVLSDQGFLVPKNIEIPVKVPDVIIIPGRFFDIFGNRIGRGKGYYDKFLMSHKKSVFIGVSLDETLTQLLPNNRDDVKMDIIVTEKEILKIN